MGWQDAPVVSGDSWQSAPVVGPPSNAAPKPQGPPQRSWWDRAKMVLGDIAAVPGEAFDVLSQANPVGFGHSLATAATGQSQEQGLYNAVMKAKGQAFADAHRQEIHDKIYGQSTGQRIYNATGAPPPATRGERIASSAVRGGGLGLLTGGASAAGGISSAVRTMAVDTVGGITGGAGAQYGGEVGGTPGAIVGGTVGALLGGRVANIGAPRAAPIASLTPGQQVYGSAQRLGMADKLLPADVGGTPTRMATAVSHMTLGGIPLAEQSAKGINALAGARNATAQAAGAVRDVTGAGQAAQAGAKAFVANSMKRGTQLYDAIPVPPKASAILSNTKSTLTDLTQGLESNPVLSEIIADPKMARIKDAIVGQTQNVPTGVLDANGQPITKPVQVGGDLSWQDLKTFRTWVGEKAGAPALQSDTSQKALKSLYGALSTDMQATAQAQGPKALQAFNRANTYWRGRQDRIENVINTILGNDLNKGANAAFEGIQRLTPTVGGDPIKLGRLMRSLSPDEADTVRATVISRMGQARPGGQDATGEVFSPAEFMTQWSKMDERSKAVLFNQNGLRQSMNDLAEVAGGMKAATKYANTSKTALAGNGALLMSGFLAHPILATGIAGIELAVGKALSSPILVRALVRIGRAPTPAATKIAIAQLGAIGAANASLRPTSTALQNALNSLNDNMPMVTGAAASPAGTDPYSDQQ